MSSFLCPSISQTALTNAAKKLSCKRFKHRVAINFAPWGERYPQWKWSSQGPHLGSTTVELAIWLDDLNIPIYIYIYSLYIHHIHFIIFIIIYSNHSKRWNQSDRLKSYPIYHPLSLSTICTCNIYIYKYWHIVNTAGLNWFRKCFRSPNSVP